MTIKCDHLPLKKFLQKQTLNAKVNNWAVELEQFNLKIEWIQGVKNTLTDSLLRLLDVDPEAKLQAKNKGHEFGTFCFESVDEIGEMIQMIQQMIQLQKNDAQAKNIVDKLRKEKDNAKMFIMHDSILCRLWTEEKENFRCTFVPQVLRDPLLILAHNQNGDNGGRCMYMALKKMYYWPGMKSEIFKHCKICKECMLQNQANTSAEFKHFKVPKVPMQLICMDLVGPISPVTSRGNCFILTCIDMLTRFTIAVLIKDKTVM